MRTASLFAAMACLILCAEVHAQSASVFPAQGDIPLTTPHRGYKPKIKLQAALRIAESYVAAEHIDVADGWLLDARFSLYGDIASADHDKEPCWSFTWITEGHGGSVAVIVFMDSKAMLLPTL